MSVLTVDARSTSHLAASSDPKSVSDEEYENFYQATFKDYEKPLGWAHFSGDSGSGTSFKAILYIPSRLYVLFIGPGDFNILNPTPLLVMTRSGRTLRPRRTFALWSSASSSPAISARTPSPSGRAGSRLSLTVCSAHICSD